MYGLDISMRFHKSCRLSRCDFVDLMIFSPLAGFLCAWAFVVIASS